MKNRECANTGWFTLAIWKNFLRIGFEIFFPLFCESIFLAPGKII